MATMIQIVLALISGAISGFIVSFYGLNMFTLIGSLLFIFLVVLFPNFYIHGLTKNIKLVEKWVHLNRKSPYYKFLDALLREEYDEAALAISKLKQGEQFKRLLVATLYIEQGNATKAKETLQGLRLGRGAALFYFNIALIEKDEETMYELKQHNKVPFINAVMETELAFSKGDVEKAEQHAKEAIEKARGLQRYLLTKSAERNAEKAERVSYF